MPAYVVFHDATLREVAATAPTTLAELAAVNGVGDNKLAAYGQQILDLLSGKGGEADEPAPEAKPEPEAEEA